MPNRRSPSRSRRAASPQPATEPLIDAADLRTVLRELSAQLAPADLVRLVSSDSSLRHRLEHITAPELSVFRTQVTLAIDCVRDHLAGQAPQIPYSTITLLGAAICYFADELDLVPDFLNRGRLDDAAVMALAFQLAESGIRRYCASTGRSEADVFAAPAAR